MTKLESYLAEKSAVIGHVGVLNLAVEFDWLTGQLEDADAECEL